MLDNMGLKETIHQLRVDSRKAERKLIREIRKWLGEGESNSMALLAARLGYRSSSTIDHWLHRGSIPESKWEQIISIIEPKGERNGKSSKRA